VYAERHCVLIYFRCYGLKSRMEHAWNMHACSRLEGGCNRGDIMPEEGSYLQKVLIVNVCVIHYLGVEEVAVRADDRFIHHNNTARLG
jgi:hypothetical protein